MFYHNYMLNETIIQGEPSLYFISNH